MRSAAAGPFGSRRALLRNGSIGAVIGSNEMKWLAGGANTCANR